MMRLPPLRGFMLPLVTLPLIPATLFNLFTLQERALLGCLIGLALPWLAARVLRRGRRGDSQKAALLMGGAAASVAALGAGAGPIVSLLLAAGAWGGARLLYDWLPEVEPPAPPKPPPPPPEGPLAEARIRLGRILASAERRHDLAIAPVAERIGAVLDDLEARPERLPRARRFLAVHLDGLERISERLDSGALPPPTLPPLLEDLAKAAEELRARLRDEETAALDIQVKVLSDRLRQEGYG